MIRNGRCCRTCWWRITQKKSRNFTPGRYSTSKYVDGAYEVTDFFPRMGGHGIWLYFTAAVLRDSLGNIVGAVETLEDITDRKNAEQELRASSEQIAASEEELRHQVDELKKGEDALRESAENYRSVIGNIQDVYYRSDRDGNVIIASPSALVLFGYASLEEVIGKSIADIFYVDPDERKKFLDLLDKTGPVHDYETRFGKRMARQS